ncbi:MAG: CoB--CoM heterodisulfide reductase iron-sulfur subunit A family protein [Desulfobacteraceae bacterium]
MSDTHNGREIDKDNPLQDSGEKKERVGVYICYCGGNISDHVEVETVRNRAEQLDNVAVARTSSFMCSDPGQEMIIEDLKNGVCDRVVVASCAPSLHEKTFRGAIERAGANPFIYEHANIREQVSWVHHGDGATDKAAKLVASATAKAELLKPLEPVRVEAVQHTTIVGAGIAGLKAALDLSARGIEVTIVEQSHRPGGALNSLGLLAPNREKASDLVKELVDAVSASKNIALMTNTTVETVDGYVGNFTVTVADHNSPENNRTTVTTGAIVMATGLKHYTPFTGELGYGRFREVITLPDLIRVLKENTPGDSLLKINNRKIRTMVMIHCVGSRRIPGIHPAKENKKLNEYCSRTCCSAALNAANQVRERFPGTRIYDMYRDIRTYGRGQEDLYTQASANRVVFMRFDDGDMPQVTKKDNGDSPLEVAITDTLTFNERLTVPCDLVVLVTGVEPADVSDLTAAMKLPVGADGFLQEVHPKLRPVEVPGSGIFLAGTCQAPMDSGEACNAAGAAAVKAAALLGKGYIELDPFVAEVDLERCCGNGDCVEACIKEGALTLVEMEIKGKKVKKARVTAAVCLGCGACAAVCREKAIDINGWGLSQYEKMVDAIVADTTAVSDSPFKQNKTSPGGEI